MFNKHYLVNVRIQISDIEFDTDVIIKAPSSDEAREYAIYLESKSPRRLKWVEDGAIDMDGKIKLSTSFKTIESHHLTALRKNFITWNFCQSDLNNCGNYLEYKALIKK
ncbi:hypothetical protein [Vibrio gangliei]|uniref:hypothetical protein n=1 Tax=Vibrio gangliei TaxID=2077090 RepID=UPI000D014A73|nr:hypothetical protein [Vibrio gangliei]